MYIYTYPSYIHCVAVFVFACRSAAAWKAQMAFGHVRGRGMLRRLSPILHK